MPDGSTQYDVFSKAADIVAAQEVARARHIGGVSWSGLSRPLDEVETVEAVAARLRADTARAAAFRRTPRGRLLTAIDEIEGYAPLEAYQLRGIYNRSISLLNGPGLDTAAVGACLAIAEGLGPMSAGPIRAALIELLLEGAERRAA